MSFSKNTVIKCSFTETQKDYILKNKSIIKNLAIIIGDVFCIPLINRCSTKYKISRELWIIAYFNLDTDELTIFHESIHPNRYPIGSGKNRLYFSAYTPPLIRVGRKSGNSSPKYPGFESVMCLTPSTKYGELSPYMLFDGTNGDRNMENLYQFSKVYEKVPHSREIYSRYNHRVIWEHPAETHILRISKNESPPKGSVRITIPEESMERFFKGFKGELYLTKEYFNWRKRGFELKEAVRYPVGFNHRGMCVGTLTEEELDRYTPGDTLKLIDYISARKEVYLPLYTRLVSKERLFRVLLDKLANNEKILIIEVDGPHQESLEYYKDKYSVSDTFIENNTSLCTREMIDVYLNDVKHPFGHGYCLAIALLREL